MLARNMVGGGPTTLRDRLVWTLVDTFLSNSKTGRDESPSSVRIPPLSGPSSAQVRNLLFYSLSNSARNEVIIRCIERITVGKIGRC
jgi:hypothetical protein